MITMLLSMNLPCRLGNDFVEERAGGVHIWGIGIGGIVFGAIHVAGWHFVFPTLVEQTLWRISSILVTCVLPAGIVILAMLSNVVVSGTRVERVLVATPIVIYIVARLYLLVEIFRTLVFLPPDAFINTWVANIPSVG